MTGNRYLLDTNIVSAILDDEPAACARADVAGPLFVPVIAVGELVYGAEKGRRTPRTLAALNRFLGGLTVLSCGTRTGYVYGQLKNALHSKGRPIPENDVWIAAVAVQYGLTLVTRDQHFGDIDGLAVERW
jgi:tRNA(fMet)-specific endonuclease VapC